MKRIFLTLLFSTLLIFLGCNNASNTPTTKSISIPQPIFDSENLSITVLSSTLEKLEIELQNNTSVDLTTSNYYVIEHYMDSEWKEVPLSLNVEDVEIHLPANEAHPFTIELYPEQHEYELGKYRVEKTVSTANGVIHPIIEFHIE